MAEPHGQARQDAPVTTNRHSMSYDTDEWESKRPLIKILYIDGDMKLPKLMKVLGEEHNFHATPRMFKRKFKKWGFHKNITERHLNRNESKFPTDDQRILGPHGRRVTPQRIKKHIKRTKRTVSSPLSSMYTPSNPSSSTSGVLNSQEYLSGISDTVQDLHGILPPENPYEEECPYRPWGKKFRFSEILQSGTLNEVDCFGYDTWIDLSMERTCAAGCFCRKHRLEENFTFRTQKSDAHMSITIYSDALFKELATHVPLNINEGVNTRTFDGLSLLRHYPSLVQRLKHLRSTFGENPANVSLTLEMELLVDGLIGDGRFFQSFGYENLHERGYMRYELWKHFQQQQLDRDITELDESFCAIDEEETSSIAKRSNEPEINIVGNETLEPAFESPTPTLSSVPSDKSPEVSPTSSSFGDPESKCSNALITVDVPGLCLPLSNVPSSVHSSPNHSYSAVETQLHQAIIEGNEKNVSLLLESLADAEIAVRFTSLLDIAVINCQERIVQIVLNCKPNVPRQSFSIDRTLQNAVNAGYEGIVRLLLDYGAHPNSNADWRRSTALHRAAESGYEGVVRLLLDHGAHLNSKDYWGGATALHRAAESGHEGVVRVLLDYGANLNLKDDWGGAMALHRAAESGHEGVVRLLLDYGADPNSKADWSSATALLRAAESGHEGVVRVLLDHGAHPNSKDHWDGATALHRAAESGYEGVVRLLLDYGANPNSKADWGGATALHIAAESGYEGVVRLLLDYGADPNSKADWGGATALLRAAGSGHEGVVRLLLDYGANVNGGETDSPLSNASGAGHDGIVRLILEYGANSNNEIGGSPLSNAAGAGHEGIVRLLLDHGANANSGGFDKSLLSYAAQRRDVNSVRLLLRAGAKVQTAAANLGEDRESVMWLRKTTLALLSSTKVGREKDPQGDVRQLRSSFRAQCYQMATYAEASQTRLQDFSRHFCNYQKAWRAGIETMRALSRGERPQDVWETLAFLLIGKAIVETLLDRRNVDYVFDFELDLGRWGQLFENPADLGAYNAALLLMWGIVADEHMPLKEDLDTLFRFQELASILVGYAKDLFGNSPFPNKSPAYWQERLPHVDQIPEDVSHRFSDHQIPAPNTPPPIDPPIALDPDPGDIYDHIKNDGSIVEPIVTFLISGAIFAIVLIFLQALRQAFINVFFPQVGTLQDRLWVLTTYLGLRDTATQTQASCPMVPYGNFESSYASEEYSHSQFDQSLFYNWQQ